MTHVVEKSQDAAARAIDNRINCVDRDAWLANRQKGIGASESPSVLGLSPFKSEFGLWAEKCDLVEREDLTDNEPAEFGIRLERPIAEAYSDRTDRNVAMWPQYNIVHDPERRWFCCTPDATQHDDVKGEGLLQIKTTSAFNASDWSEGPPLFYQVQLQHELAVTGFDWGTLVVLIGGQRLRFFDCERNDRFIAALIPRLEAFWRMVETRTEPPVDGSMATAKVLAKLHPNDNGQTIMLPQEAASWCADLERIKAEKKAAEEKERELSNKLKAAFGDSTFGVTADGQTWSYKTQNRAGYTVEPTSYRVMRKVK